MKSFICLLAAIIAASPAWGAQSETPPALENLQETPSLAAKTDTSPAPDTGDCGCVPAGTPIELEIDQLLNSATQSRGDRFAIKLHAPVIRDGIVLVPAGTLGVGEVIHADRSRGGGKPGELLIAARYLDFEGAQIPLRGLKLGGQGKDNSKIALGTAIAIGPFAHFIRGREIEIPAGTVVSAKLARDLPIPAASTPEAIPERSREAAPAASSTAAPTASTN